MCVRRSKNGRASAEPAHSMLEATDECGWAGEIAKQPPHTPLEIQVARHPQPTAKPRWDTEYFVRSRRVLYTHGSKLN
jgi:hypothetical protein